jgi:peptide/nickel transport system substrate-binding protein
VSERLTGTVTFLFTDIEGSTSLLKALGRERYATLLAEHQQLLRDAFGASRGEEVDTQGDSFLVAFRRASDAVAASVALERALADHAWPDGADVRVRVGIHTGEADAAGQRYVGFSVHRAARIGAAAHGGQVLVSSSTRELVGDDLPPDVTLRDLGLYKLKDVDRPERISQVTAAGLRVDFPALRGAERVRAPAIRRRSLLAAALIGVLAAAVAIPVFALSSGGSQPSQVSAGSNAVRAVDASSGRSAGSVGLGAAPKGVAYGDGSVWVTSPDADSVSRVNPPTDGIQQTIGVGDGPSGVAFGGGFVWVTNSLGGTVSQIDPQKNGGQEVARIDVGNGPAGIAYGLGAVWVANSVDRTVRRIDPLTGARGKPIPVPAGADAISFGDGALWVTSNAAGVLSRVDPRFRTVTSINVGNGPSAVAARKDAVWVANSGDATVWRIDPATNRVTETVQVGEGPSGVALSDDGTVWVSSELDGTLSKIDPAAGKVVKKVTVGDRPQAVAMGGDTTYVALEGTGSAHRGGTLTLLVSNPSGVYDAGLPKSLDPAYGYTAWELTTLTNDGLVAFGRSGGVESTRIVPNLAVALPSISDGGRTYTFRLRPGITYSDGTTVQPADVRRAIERVFLVGGDLSTAPYFAGIVGATACVEGKRCDLSKGIVTGANTVTFHLREPDPDFLYKLALPTADAVPASTPLAAKLPLPATGPYMVDSIDKKKSKVRLVRNPRFHVWSAAAQPDGYPDVIVERWGLTGARAVRAVERGTADVTSTGLDKTWSPALMSALRTRYSSRLYATPQSLALGFWMNTRVKPFDDVRVRRAVNYAVDRNEIVAINGGPANARVGCQILLPNTNGYRPYCPYTVNPDAAGTYHGPDVAQARRLVAASGTAGEPITVWSFDIPPGRANGSYLTSVLRSLGYKARLELIPHVPGRVTWAPDHQTGLSGWFSDYPSANNILSPRLTCASYKPNRGAANGNYPGFCDRRIDAEIAQARAVQTTDPSAASRLWEEIDREITDQAPWVTMHTSLLPDFVSRRTGNYTYCYLSGGGGSTDACLDQLWVR